MKTNIKHAILDLQDAINQERDIALEGIRITYINVKVQNKDDLKMAQKAIRTAYKEKFEVEKQRIVNNEEQNKQTFQTK